MTMNVQHNIHWHSFLVLRDDILVEDKNKDEDIKDTENENEDIAALQSGDSGQSSSNMKDSRSSLKSPEIPVVPHNSFATDTQQVTKSAQGLYSALEALSSSTNGAKQLNSLVTSKKN